MKYVFINNNKVEKIVESEEETTFEDAHHYQQVIDVTALDPYIEIGMTYNNGQYYFEPPPITPRQARQALVLSGILIADVEAAMNTLPEPMKTLAHIEWEYSTEFHRRRDLVINMGLMLGWSPKQLDDLWFFAGKL